MYRFILLSGNLLIYSDVMNIIYFTNSLYWQYIIFFEGAHLQPTAGM